MHVQVSLLGVQQRDPGVSTNYPDIDERRLVTIARLWNITETLNVLYRENWTMMANTEIINFQNELIASIKQEMRGDRQTAGCNNNKVKLNGLIMR